MSEVIIGNYQQLKSECNLIRQAVFIEEQNISPELELDDRDQHCLHAIIQLNRQTIGTARIDLEKQGKIGRLAILKPYRNQGYGKRLLQKLEEIAKQECLSHVWLNAQKSSLNFYLKLGYQIVSEEFLEANIIHLEMKKQLILN